MKNAMFGLVLTAAVAAQGAWPYDQVDKVDVDPLGRIVKDWQGARPAKPHKVLWFSECFGYNHHGGRCYGDWTFKKAGEASGAWEIVQEKDVKRLADASYLAGFDAIVFNNSTGVSEKLAPGLEKALTEFVKGGKGLALIHAGLDAFKDSDLVMYMIGGWFKGHPWHDDGTWKFVNEAGAHPVNASFRNCGTTFFKQDEIYQFPAFFDRSTCTVLVSVDLSDPLTKEAELWWNRRFGPGSTRADHDYAVSWVKDWGKGRIFYTSFGHDRAAFLDRDRLYHMFAGLQYVLGDIGKVDAAQYGPDKALKRTDWAGGPAGEVLDKRVKDAQGQELDFVFFGDSITMGWTYPAVHKFAGGQEIWEKRFGKLKTMNLGMSGDRTEHLLWRVTEGGQADDWKAKTIFVMIGINNHGQTRSGWMQPDTPAEAARGTKAILKALKTRHPESRIVLFGALPWAANDGFKWVRDYNAILATFDGGNIVYRDMNDKFLVSPDVLRKDLFRDGLHPNPAGYEIFAAEMDKILGEKDETAFRLADAVVVKAKVDGDRAKEAMTAAVADLTNVIFHVTGKSAPIYADGAEPKDAKAVIYVGPCAAAKAAGLDGANLRNGDGRIKTVPGKAFLYGKTPWGAQNAVVEFAERFCDHWVVSVDAHDVYTRDPERAIPVKDRTIRPAVYSRELYHGMYNGYRNPKTCPAWSRYARMSRAGYSPDIEGRYRLSHAVKGFNGKTTLCHSQFSYLPVEKYFKDHPEYYSMGEDGKRHGTANFDGQLCFTNPDVYRLVLESLERFVAEDRAKNPSNPPCVYDFTQLDSCDRLCLCPECRKVIAKYDRNPGGHNAGGDAGLQLEFVNRLARDIRKKYKDVYIRTFAYVSSERAPKPGTIEVDPNVIIWWCDLYSTCDHTQPLTKGGHYNELHARNLREWAALTSNLQIWDYKLAGAAWDYTLMNGLPEICGTAMQEDARFFAQCKVPCYFIEQYPGQPLYELEFFLNSHLLIDPGSDVDALVRTFCRGYGRAADDMYAAISFLRHELESRPASTPNDWHVRNLPWVDRPTFERLAAMADAAYAKEPDPAIRPRLARFAVSCWKTLIGIYKKDPSAKAALKKAIDAYRRYGNEIAETAFMEPARRPEAKAQVATDIELLTLTFNDLPEALKAVSADELVCVDYHFRRDGKVVEDKVSERGFSIKVQDFKEMPLACGLYDEQSKDSYGFKITAEANPADGTFRWNRLGRCHIGHGTIFWFPGSWRSTFSLKPKYIQADGLAVDPNWYEVWASFRRTEKEAFIDRLAFRRVPPPTKK